jgi:signal transduction histidine kinase
MEGPSVRVLLVEDDEDDFIAVRSYLTDVPSPRFEIEWVRTCSAALEALSCGHHDVCLLDYRLGEHDGLDLLEKSIHSGCRIPIIFLTGYGDRSLDMEAMKAGACDYLVKARIDSQSLERSIRYAIANRRAAEVLERAYEELERKVEERTRELKAANESLMREVAERKRTEEALQRAHHDLEIRVRERTAELATLNQDLQEEIDERKRAENALRNSERQLRYLSSRLLTAQEEERKRIARELHDSIGSSLSAVKFGLESALSQVEQSVVASQPLNALVSVTQTAMDEVRRIMTDLRPSILDDLGIVVTIGWLSRQHQSIYPAMRIEQEICIAEAEVPEQLKIVVFRVIQEALNNIAKHSTAKLVNLSLSRVACTIFLKIEDNGIGFDPEAVLSMENSKKGLGLTSMKERVELSGGVFHIESAAGQGTSISAAWPLGPTGSSISPRSSSGSGEGFAR